MSIKTQIRTAAEAAPESGNFYTQSAGANESRTFIPGMKRKHAETPQAGTQPDTPQAAPQHIVLQTRPVAGVLYSVSRDNCGEIFPVYVGRNIIGCEPESDVYLTESTVSPRHAVLLIRVIPLPDGTKKITRSITDSNSDFGTAVNGEPLSDDIQPIAAGDIIRIGNAYELLFIPIDADAFGLGPVAGFVATPRVENRPSQSNDYLAYMAPPTDNTVYPDAVGAADEFTFYGRTKKSRDDNSNKKTL